MSELISAKADEIVEDIAKKEELKVYAFDPFTIMAIINIIIQLIKMFMELKNKPEDVLETFKKPGLIEKWRMRKLIRKYLDDEDVYALLGDSTLKSTTKVLSGMTVPELVEISEV